MDMGADIYVVESQGEHTLARVVHSLTTGEPLQSVPNLAYFEGRKLRLTATEKENNPLDDNTIPWSDFPAERLGPTIQVRTARSCAFNCSFCNYPTRAGKLAVASLEAVKRELDSIRELGGVQNVIFVDDTFNVPLARFKDICRLMIDERYGFNWFSYFRCANSDDEAFELMARSGCKGVFLGIESGSPRILQNMNKASTIEKYAYGTRRLREHGILTFGSFIAGFPGETAETIQETIDFIRNNPLDYYRAQLWYCEPGTPIQRDAEKYKIEGEGFVWKHETMNNKQAMEHIRRMFLEIKESVWLPLWSFDFWIIPYLFGRGLTKNQFREFLLLANELLRFEIQGINGPEKTRKQREILPALTRAAAKWRFVAQSNPERRPKKTVVLGDETETFPTALYLTPEYENN
jgi:p-methyltransferase